MKIMIIGSSGSGKSTFARELGKITSYPILHLDKVFHKYPSEIAREKLREATRIFIFQNENIPTFPIEVDFGDGNFIPVNYGINASNITTASGCGCV